MRLAKTLFVVFAGFMANYVVFETAALHYGIDQGLSLFWFAAMFIIADFLTVPLPYFLSDYMIRRLPSLHAWLNQKIRPRIKRLEKVTGDWGEIIGFSAISYFTSTWLASVIAAMVSIDFKRAFIGIVAGDLIFFATLYGSIAGFKALLPESRWKFWIIILAAMAVVMALQKIVRLWLNVLTDKNNGPVA